MTIASGSCCLIIKGQNLDFTAIEDNLLLKPTEVCCKGSVISEVVKPLEKDVWIYEQKFNSKDEISSLLKRFLKKLKYRDDHFLERLGLENEVCIRLYVQSNYAQIYFSFSPEILKELSDLNLKFEVSILSWGEVDS